MKNNSSGFSKFISYSFICHIVIAIFLVLYADNYQQKQKEMEEIQKQEDRTKEEAELKKDIEEILSEIVEEVDEKKKEEIIEEMKDKVWEELKEELEDLLGDKKDLEKEKYLEELAKETQKAIEDLKKKDLEEEKKKELIEELIAKDLPEIEKKIAEEIIDKTLEELEKNALKDSLAELKKTMEEEIKPVLEKNGFLEKIDELIKQLGDNTKKEDSKSLQEEIKNILEKTEEIVDKTDEATKKFAEASKDFKTEQLDVALDVFKNKERAVNEKKAEVAEVFQKTTESEKTKANFTKLPETEKDWTKAIGQITEQPNKPEEKNILSKPLEELAKLDAEKNKAEKVLKEIMNEELADVKKASEEVKKVVTDETASKKVSALQKELDGAANKSQSKFSNEFTKAAETIQSVKKALPEIAKSANKSTTENKPKDPLDKAIQNLQNKELALEKKKEEVAIVINKTNSADKAKMGEKTEATKLPTSDKEWKQLIEQSKEKAKTSDNKKQETPLEKSVSELATLDAEKSKAESELKNIAKESAAEAKKVASDLEKSAKKNENKKQVSDVKKAIEKAEKQTESVETQNVKDGAEALSKIKNELPEIARAIKNADPSQPKEDKKDITNKPKDTATLKVELEVAKNLVENSIKGFTELKTGVEMEDKVVTERIEARVAKANELQKSVVAEKNEKNENKFSEEQTKEPKDSLENALKILNDVKAEIAKEEQSLKKELDTLKKNFSEKEKIENKDAVSGLESAVKNLTQSRAVEPKLAALDQAESMLNDIKSNINEQRKDALTKSQEQLQKFKDLAQEISEGLKNPDEKKSKDSIMAEIENQAMAKALDEKTKTFESFLTENESENAEKQSKEFKEEAKNNVNAALKRNSDNKDDNNSEAENESNENASEESSSEENASEEEGEGSGEEGEKSKNKSKGNAKGEKGKGEGNQEGKDSEIGQENSALAKALADKVGGQGKKGEGKQDGKESANDSGAEDDKKENNNNGKNSGQRLDGGSKSPAEIAQNIILRTTKVFNKATVSAEDEKRIFTENINYEAIRIPPVIKFAKPTSSGLPIEVRESSLEIFTGAEATKTKVLEKPKNPERDRVKHEKFTKGNFTAIPYLRNKPQIDGKKDDWELDKSWVKKDKQIAMGWRSDGLYFFASIRDRTDKFENSTTSEMFATWWRFDSVELWIDMQNSKSDDTNKFDCQQFTFWPALTNIRTSPELYEVLWGKRASNTAFRDRKVQVKHSTQNVVASVEHPDRRGYDIEVYIPSENLLNRDFFKGGQVAGFLYIINHGNLVEDSSLEFYKEGYDGYSSHPSSWGNVQLLGTDAKIEQIDADKKVVKEKIIETSTNLTIRVSDNDANLDPNIIDKVTVRIKNENNFEGIKSEDTDWEDVKFTETGKDTGVFTGTITLTVAPSKPDDNAICAQPGDTLHAYYNDHIQVAGEYDEKTHLRIKVVAPIIKVAGSSNPSKD